MTDLGYQPEQAAVRGLLLAVGEELGRPVPPEWKAAVTAVPRHHFLPDRVWLEDDDGALRACDSHIDPERWFQAAYENAPVVTQVNGGNDPDDEDDLWPSSSASSPTMVVRMLEDLDLRPGLDVLEIGTGTGWNAALLAHRLGPEYVASVEIDPAVARQARASLNAAALNVEVICGDGALGWSPGLPYDRIISTCAVRRVPKAWIEQTKPGGIIVTPWDSPMLGWCLLKLTIERGQTHGRFSPHSSFMLMRNQRTNLRIFRDVVRDGQRPGRSTTRLSPWLVGGNHWEARFALGLTLDDVWTTWEHEPDVPGVTTRLWVATTDAGSWAAVDHDGEQDDRFTVWQFGERRLWDEVEAAYAWWEANNRPGPARFGLTITEGGQQVWLDDPAEKNPFRHLKGALDVAELD
ncbi:methyltransferase domain-containing protein [Streptomyces sp. CB01881]|uniref:methyltransferase domain-containing protein n=1 Tax=Streptomyces sp. CB01881 TaxID=2078691 RepID=UPI0011DF32B9|nr:methyltransferase domain-containing protein [Streptomyces sp. CB01881]TYC66280.1 methyltransferase domain-containing protein [Streptomyces sp. CB01881]